jgi:hypothetical protein
VSDGPALGGGHVAGVDARAARQKPQLDNAHLHGVNEREAHLSGKIGDDRGVVAERVDLGVKGDAGHVFTFRAASNMAAREV